MSVFKCKMCGGSLEIVEDSTVAECEYCGTKQTVPTLDSEKKLNLFSRANRLRFACEFDKAYGVYESIVAEFPEEAEAYWGLILCKYGIEYVDDPKTGKKIPTCHRSSFEGVFDDPNFELVMENSDAVSRAVYREEAKEIERLRTQILDVSSKEEPYDIFICYKETDAMGERTIDSVIAQDVYDALTEKGYKVFFSRITLEDKLGQDYEPYIFAALNSAKVMLAFGTDYEHYNAVWVKNEWSRYLSLIEKGEKKVLIPCYKGIDAYDMPKEFARLQAQDMGKIGAVQDLLRGIEKIIGKKKEANADNGINHGNNTESLANSTEPLLKRAFMFLEDGDWAKADDFCEQVLNKDPENAQAYLGKLMAKKHVSKRELLKNLESTFTEDNNYKKILRFGDEKLILELTGYTNFIEERNESKSKSEIYSSAISKMERAATESDYIDAAEIFELVKGFRDAEEKASNCRDKAKLIKEEVAQKQYQYACQLMDNARTEADYKEASLKFEKIKGYNDADERFVECNNNARYISAVHKMETADSVASFVATATMFESIISFKDSDALLGECLNKADELRKDEDIVLKALLAGPNKTVRIIENEINENEQKKKALEDLYENYDNKNNKINKLNEYLTILENKIEPLVSKQSGLGLFAIKEKKQIEEELFPLKVKQVDTITSIKELKAEFNGYTDKNDIKEELNHITGIINNLQDKLQQEVGSNKYSYDQALRKYKNTGITKELNNKNPKLPFITGERGDIVGFGSFKQNNDATSCYETIEWQILNRVGNRLLLISRYALDCKKYNSELEDTTWEKCSLRQWLNDTFINNAFSMEEQAAILTVQVKADSNPQFGNNPGNTTTDKIFLLSITESNNYFVSDTDRLCKPTEFAEINGTYKNDNGNCWWWLRSPGYDSCDAAIIDCDGEVRYRGNHVHYGNGAVRPALWIDIESLLEKS